MRPHPYHIKDKIIAHFNYTSHEAWKFAAVVRTAHAGIVCQREVVRAAFKFWEISHTQGNYQKTKYIEDIGN